MCARACVRWCLWGVREPFLIHAARIMPQRAAQPRRQAREPIPSYRGKRGSRNVSYISVTLKVTALVALDLDKYNIDYMTDPTSFISELRGSAACAADWRASKNV